MELERLKAIIDLVSQSTVTELEIVDGGVRVRIAKSSTTPEPSGTITRKAPRTLPVRPPAPDPADASPGPHAVTSPMLGIFHRAQSPESSPYVQSGARVRTGDPLCVIEAMKSFNVIASDRDGTVTAILVENGQEVEPGQALFQIGT